jgi:phosphoribosylaminoimidazolecarboxamide formyltransferase/IMP cyclohydrolase
MNKSRAILSVSDKTGLVPFAQGLLARGFELVSTGGTAKALAAAGLPVTGISDVTGFPEMMDGRVKTLHPAVHGGILARRNRPDDLAAIAAHGITPIDLVAVNLYPFGKAAENPDTPFEALVEEIDIGGPSLVRAAAKNFRDVLVVVNPEDYSTVLEQLDRTDGPALDFRFRLMSKAFMHTGQYDAMIAMTMGNVEVADGQMTRQAGTRRSHQHPQPKDLRYGENPHQKATWVPIPEQFNRSWTVHQGKELSYTNLLDLDAALRLVLEFSEAAAVVIKHTNPCGVSTAASIDRAYVQAREVDPLSAFGGIVGLNRAIDITTAQALTATFIEAVIAPAIDEEARAILASKPNMRVLTTDFAKVYEPIMSQEPREMRSFLGGLLLQEPDRVVEATEPWPQADYPRVVTKRQPTPEEWAALRFAWKVCAHVKSNTIVFAAHDRTLAVGAGQMSRVDSVKIAVTKAGADKLKGSAAASDAFFPFRDGLDVLAQAGATAVVQPGGSVRDAEVIAAADEQGVAMVFTGKRHFRH